MFVNSTLSRFYFFRDIRLIRLTIGERKRSILPNQDYILTSSAEQTNHIQLVQLHAYLQDHTDLLQYHHAQITNHS